MWNDTKFCNKSNYSPSVWDNLCASFKFKNKKIGDVLDATVLNHGIRLVVIKTGLVICLPKEYWETFDATMNPYINLGEKDCEICN